MTWWQWHQLDNMQYQCTVGNQVTALHFSIIKQLTATTRDSVSVGNNANISKRQSNYSDLDQPINMF